MSKKTKKEKIIASYRKRLKLLSLSENTPDDTKSVYIPQKDHKDIDHQIKQNLTHSGDGSKNKFFIKDFRKSIFIISLIITLEIVLYFVTINR